MRYFLRNHPDVTIEDFSVVNRSHDFAKVVVTYRGDLALNGDRAR